MYISILLYIIIVVNHTCDMCIVDYISMCLIICDVIINDNNMHMLIFMCVYIDWMDTSYDEC
jgi:hypothetical protein